MHVQSVFGRTPTYRNSCSCFAIFAIESIPIASHEILLADTQPVTVIKDLSKTFRIASCRIRQLFCARYLLLKMVNIKMVNILTQSNGIRKENILTYFTTDKIEALPQNIFTPIRIALKLHISRLDGESGVRL